MQTCITERVGGEIRQVAIPEIEQRLHSRTMKVQEEQVEMLEKIMGKLCSVGFEIFVGKDSVTLVSSFSNITYFETFMYRGLEEEMRKIEAGGKSVLTLEELKFLSAI